MVVARMSSPALAPTRRQERANVLLPIVLSYDAGRPLMAHFVCTTCGTQCAEGDQPPAVCAICADSRQYVKATGQTWTTLDKLCVSHRNTIKFAEAGLLGIGMEPHFAIGQRALFVRTADGNILWDCV